jgi:predicted DNA-binding WGR domain protein
MKSIKLKLGGKFYNMEQKDENTFVSTWGRDGSAPMSAEHSMSRWDSLLDKKRSNGYSVLEDNSINESVIITNYKIFVESLNSDTESEDPSLNVADLFAERQKKLFGDE